MYVPRSQRGYSFNAVIPLRGGGEAFPAMLEAIASAEHHVHLEMYILRDDRTGQEFKERLIERRRAGVTVRVMYDSLGSLGLSSAYLNELRHEGVEVIEFHPVAPWRSRWSLNRRDHQKILVVDDRVALVGGINIGDEYQPTEKGGKGWHDMHASVEGPAVVDIARVFRTTWIKAGGASFPPPRWNEKRSLPWKTGVSVISSVFLFKRFRMRRAYIYAIENAERTISLMNAYFIPDRGLRRAFARAARRGVSVRVVVPSVSDVRAVYYASCYLYSRLMRAGVRLFEWPDRMMHAKSGVIDEVWSTIGSYNLDRRSMIHNLELSLIMIDRELGAGMETQFDEDLRGCREVDPVAWERRPLVQKVLEWLFFQLRYWL